jgi:hypothetical protein
MRSAMDANLAPRSGQSFEAGMTMRCGCIEASAGFLAGLAVSAIAWQFVTPSSWVVGLVVAATLTLTLTAGAGWLGRSRARGQPG